MSDPFYFKSTEDSNFCLVRIKLFISGGSEYFAYKLFKNNLLVASGNYLTVAQGETSSVHEPKWFEHQIGAVSKNQVITIIMYPANKYGTIVNVPCTQTMNLVDSYLQYATVSVPQPSKYKL